ncbi:MAG: small subunit ribosomal protein [Patescibacteria group bacterium]|jgi:small subunit ribosomal protein S9|nr:small subunit ribosomal protein [Patescibacteria group bacterium]
MPKNDYFYGLGRRKSSTARARLSGGKGNITVNEKPASEYFNGNEAFIYELLEPLRLLQKTDSFDISLKIEGGGHHSQIGASKLAIAKAVSVMNEDLRTTLKKANLLKRDSREKERMKPGLKGARRKEQFSKR